ncbi:MAG: glycosyl transferase family 2 [Hyphomicrobiales bacterium]|nr:glycosyl transferase family 2 [Hyphomicrobiales bacterium]
MRLSIIVPVLNEAERLPALLAPLQAWRADGCQLIVADGGSADGSPAIVRPLCDALVEAPRGRAAQMNAGAREARGDALLFLHADTHLPSHAPALVRAALAGAVWGRFDVRIEGRSLWLPLVSRMINWRSRLTGVATGDQALFVRRDVFERLGGFADVPLMEDVELTKRLRSIGRPACLRGPALTSGRRWDRHGAWRTILLMWRLRAEYFCGADPRRLAVKYGYAPRDS